MSGGVSVPMDKLYLPQMVKGIKWSKIASVSKMSARPMMALVLTHMGRERISKGVRAPTTNANALCKPV